MPIQLKIHVLFKTVNKPWGGGNQFIKNLIKFLKKNNHFEEHPHKADVILFNSHHYINELFTIKSKYPEKIIIHRVDGPVSLIRGNDKKTDNVIFYANDLLADGTIFQSNWSRTKCIELGIKETKYSSIILNAPNPDIFNLYNKLRFNPLKKIKIVATSWSDNKKKGFSIYHFLDEHLDFSKYEMTFIGRSPIKFNNIDSIGVLEQKRVAEILKNHHIYITASMDDPCSNSLLEALHCGLPTIARNSGGHPEIVRNAGVLFKNENDILIALEKIVNNYNIYKKNINLPNIDEQGMNYYNFAYEIFNKFSNNEYIPKQLSPKNISCWKNHQFKLFFGKMSRKVIRKLKNIL